MTALCFLLSTGPVAAATFTAASCNRSDVNAVINGPTHVAVDGDTIRIPAGSCAWTSGITIPSGMGISIIGAGTPDNSPATKGASASCSATVITDNSNSSLFRFRPVVSSSLSRISCMKIRSDNAAPITAPFAFGGTCNTTTCPNMRLDNVTLDNSLQGMVADSGALIVTDNMFGVIDHNTVLPGSNSTSGMQFIAYNNSAWNGVGAYGDNSWSSASSFGTARTLYLENNSWGEGVVIGETESQVPYGGQGGGRIAARFNTCNGCASGLSNHGTDSNGRPRGGRQVEFYNNTFVCTYTLGGCQGGVPVRSGVNIMFGNSLTAGPGSWFNAYLNLGAFRATTIWGPPWGKCDGTGAWDNNSVSPPICIDQPSRSGGTLLSGNPPTPTGWVNQVIDPSYEWNDSGYNPVFGNVSSSYGGMIANRDWYTDNSRGTPQAQTSRTYPFNGTSGVGFGTLANRPTTCTPGPGGAPGVAYWATDQGNWNQSGSGGQGQLYVCASANTWIPYYTPYTYPHPLTLQAAPRQAASCSQPDVQAAINAAQDGDTVQIPAGTCTWPNPVIVGNPSNYNDASAWKAITIQGAGIDQTIIVDGIDKSKAGIWPDFTPFQALYWPTKNGGPSRLTGMTFQGGTIADPYNKGIVEISGNSDQFRMDHVKIIPTKTSGVFFHGNVRGVLDHSIFTINAWLIGIYVFHDSWNNIGEYGDASYADDSNLGTSQAIFIENNLFESNAGAPAIDGWSGSRVVFRHNTLRNSVFANHGTETSGRWRSQRTFEVYNNTFTHDVWQYPNVIGIRGGTGVAFNNTAITTGSGYITQIFGMVNYRYSDRSRIYTPFGFCDGSNIWDGNQDSTGYPCLDQPGRGRGILFSGWDPTPVGWPAQVLDPVYAWNNTLNGSPSPLKIRDEDKAVIVEGRDFYNAVKPGYTPYVYPHPLVSGTTPLPGTACDVNTDGSTTVADVQVCANQAIGLNACTTGDINGDAACNVIDVQRVVNAALGGPCVTP